MFELKAIEMIEGFQQREMEYQRQIESLKKMLNQRKEEEDLANESIDQLDQLDKELCGSEKDQRDRNLNKKNLKESND